MRRLLTVPFLLVGLAAFVLLVIQGCLPTRPGPVIQTYQLNPVPDPEHSARPVYQPVPATLLVNTPKARAGFDTSRMAYVKRPHELQYFSKNQWAETPARMLTPPLTQALERSGIWDAVVVMPSIVRGSYRLDIDNLVLQQEFLESPSQIHLSLRAQLIDVHKQCVMGTTDFDVLQPASSDDPYGGVLAANQAAAKLLEQLVAWLSTYMNESAQQGCERSSPTSNRTGMRKNI